MENITKPYNNLNSEEDKGIFRHYSPLSEIVLLEIITEELNKIRARLEMPDIQSKFIKGSYILKIQDKIDEIKGNQP